MCVVNSLETSGNNCNTSLVSTTVGTVLRIKIFGIEYLICVAPFEQLFRHRRGDGCYLLYVVPFTHII
jgi:hypothetical protein